MVRDNVHRDAMEADSMEHQKVSQLTIRGELGKANKVDYFREVAREG